MNIDGYDAWRLQSPPESTVCSICCCEIPDAEARRWFGEADEIECDSCTEDGLSNLADTLEYRGEK